MVPLKTPTAKEINERMVKEDGSPTRAVGLNTRQLGIRQADGSPSCEAAGASAVAALYGRSVREG